MLNSLSLSPFTLTPAPHWTCALASLVTANLQTGWPRQAASVGPTTVIRTEEGGPQPIAAKPTSIAAQKAFIELWTANFHSGSFNAGPKDILTPWKMGGQPGEGAGPAAARTPRLRFKRCSRAIYQLTALGAGALKWGMKTNNRALRLWRIRRLMGRMALLALTAAVLGMACEFGRNCGHF